MQQLKDRDFSIQYRARASLFTCSAWRSAGTAAPEFDSSEAHLRPTPSNGAGFSGMTRKKPRYTDC